MSSPIPQADWKWFGCPGHLIVGQDCRFHLCTQVGKFLISTVGEYLPDAPVREILAESRGIILTGQGDNRRGDYMSKIGFEEVGFQRKYETMVFEGGIPCTDPHCNCGCPLTSGSEIEMKGYNNAGDATRGHLELCLKFSALGEMEAVHE